MNICACGCGQEFEPGSQPRKYYSDACKQRIYRKRNNDRHNVTAILASKREIKPILKYPGSKWRIAQWIISQFPEHTMYLEPYCGSAAVFLQKEQVEHEILNDINGDIVNLFRVLRNNADTLSSSIALTPWAREEYELAYEATDDAIEQARRFLVRCWQAHGVRINHRTGWRNIGPKGNAQTTPVWDRLPERLMAVALRLKKAEIENTPALDLIRKYNSPEWLIYADPPYVLDTRNGTYYSHEMSLEDHQELLHTLSQHRGPVVLSGYAHELYDSTLAGWHRVTMPALAEHGKQTQEVLWLNPQASTNRQLSFNFEIA